MGPLELGELVADRDRRAVALVAVLGGVALDGQSLRLPGLLEHRAALEQRGLGLGAVVARDGEGVAVVLQALEGVLARLQLGGRLRDGVLGDLEPARVLDAARLEVVDRALELALGAAGAAVRAADRGLEPVAQGALVALEARELVVADGGRRAEEALRRDARDRGELLVGARRVGDRVAAQVEADGALRAAERLGQAPVAGDPVLVLVAERHRDRRAGVGVAVPGQRARRGRRPSSSPCASARSRSPAGSWTCRPRWGRGRS